MKKTFLLLAAMVALNVWADAPTASVASVQIYYCTPESASVAVTCEEESYTWQGETFYRDTTCTKVFVNQLGCDSTVTLNLTFKKVYYFTVGGGINDKVVFSPGNLQWCFGNGSPLTHKDGAGNTQEGVFRFAANQWDMIGADADANKKSSDCAYNSWTDLLVIGNLYNKDNGTVNDTYKPYPNSMNSLSTSWSTNTRRAASTYSNITLLDKEDWGYHEIQNGSKTDASGTWRSITSSEMTYLLNTRTNHDQLRGFAKVNNVKGVILLPDGFDFTGTGLTFNSYATLTNVGDSWNHANLSTYTTAQWATLEALGAVFLPLAGRETDSYNSYGSYTASTSNTTQAYYWTFPSSLNVFFFDFGAIKVDNYGSIDYRCAVRLVRSKK